MENSQVSHGDGNFSFVLGHLMKQDIKVKDLNEGILLDRNGWSKLIHVPDPT